MSNNLTVAAKSATWTRTPAKYMGRRTALNSGFFTSARLYLPVMVGRVELPSGRSALRVADSAKLHSTDHPIEIRTSVRWSLNKIRRLTMAQLRLKDRARLSVYATRVRNTIQRYIPIFGDSPRFLLDEQEISELSKLPIDKVHDAVAELQREGWIAPFYNGRPTKSHVYACQNPSFKGSAMEVWA